MKPMLESIKMLYFVCVDSVTKSGNPTVEIKEFRGGGRTNMMPMSKFKQKERPNMIEMEITRRGEKKKNWNTYKMIGFHGSHYAMLLPLY